MIQGGGGPSDTTGEIPNEKKEMTEDDFAPLDSIPLASEGSPTEEFLSPAPPAPVIEEPKWTPAPPPAAEPTPSSEAFEAIKSYASETLIGHPQVDPDLPFDLCIEGFLSELEQGKLFGILKENSVSIRTSELEPQFESGRVFIPQISEYIGIILAQALHASHLKFSLFPSRGEPSRLEAASWQSSQQKFRSFGVQTKHEAEEIPVLPTYAELKKWKPDADFQPLDVITASAVLRTSVVEARDSVEYQELLDNLQREIRFKAFRKGAAAVVDFNIQLNPLGPPGFFRVTCFGTAVKQS